MKHQIWLEDWERELVRLGLIHLSVQAASRVDKSLTDIEAFSLRWTRRQLDAVGEKFAVRDKK